MAQVIPLTEDKYKIWDEFALESTDAWFWHTTRWLDYCVAYGRDSFGTRNISFFLVDGSGVLAICPLLLEKRKASDGAAQFEMSTAGGGFGIVPAIRNDLSEERREKVLKAIYENVDLLAEKHHAVRACFRMTPLSVHSSEFNWLVKYGYLDSSLYTQVMDLSPPLDHLWSAVRKGHKYDVHRGEKHYEIHIWDKDNPDKDAFDQYRLLHHKAAGRITRPLETFEMMYDWILSGEGMFCGVSKDGKFAAFSYILLYKDGAYYASASDDPDFETDTPTSHTMQWKVINWLKEKGYRRYEIGIQQFGLQIHDIPSRKDLSISFFKRGFGGKTVSLYRGVRYYDRKFMEMDLRNNLESLLSLYQTWACFGLVP